MRAQRSRHHRAISAQRDRTERTAGEQALGRLRLGRQRLGDSGWATAAGRQRLGDSGWATAAGRQRLGDSGWATAAGRRNSTPQRTTQEERSQQREQGRCAVMDRLDRQPVGKCFAENHDRYVRDQHPKRGAGHHGRQIRVGRCERERCNLSFVADFGQEKTRERRDKCACSAAAGRAIIEFVRLAESKAPWRSY